jgi:integrase/recombinase XerD
MVLCLILMFLLQGYTLCFTNMQRIVFKKEGSYLHFCVPKTLREFVPTKAKFNSTSGEWRMLYESASLKELFKHFKGRAWLDLRAIGIGIKGEPRLELKPLSHDEKSLHPLSTQAIYSFRDFMIQQRFAKSTIEQYTSMVKTFFAYFKDKQPAALNTQDLEIFNRRCIIDKAYSNTYQRQMLSALKRFYFWFPEEHQMHINQVEYVPKSKKLPTVLSEDEVKRILEVIHNPKHKLIVAMLYSCGLRVSELIHLKIYDIDFERSEMHIRESKGAKDRKVPLRPRMLSLIKSSLKTSPNRSCLVEGQNGNFYSSSSINKIIKRACKNAGIQKKVSAHTFRHSIATHLVENKVSIRAVQLLLGHGSIKTTELYVHLSSQHIKHLPNPFDDML